MAVYPTKIHKINNNAKMFKVGLALTSVFSILLILLIFNFFEIFSLIVLGSIGLSIYPISIFFIVLGILLMCKKKIKTTKSVLIFSILWLVIFLLILQMITSKDIDSEFGTYITTTFKYNVTAGGVLFGTILYPLYYITYDIATYVILAILLVIDTSLLIDRIYVDVRNKKSLEVINENNYEEFEDEENIDETQNDEDFEYQEIENSEKTDDDIFISDDEEQDNKLKAKEILGLCSATEINEDEIIDEEDDEDSNSQSQIISNISQIKSSGNKPNVFVHEEDDFSQSVNNSPEYKFAMKKPEIKDNTDEIRRNEAKKYLEISQGKFKSNNEKRIFDNVVGNNKELFKNNDEKAIKFEDIKANNDNRLSNMSSIKALNNQSNANVKDDVRDIYDEDFTKKDFMQNQERIAKENTSLNSIFDRLNGIKKETEASRAVYNGSVNENRVESVAPKPVQIHIEEPRNVPKNEPKVYKKPPTYVRPPIDLLKKYSTDIEDDTDFINEKGQLIVDTLKAFKIDTTIINATKGPTFTRFELQIAPGISVNSINSKINNLSMVLESPCRVQVPIPGKNAFGIEIPNKKRMIVGLREMIESQNFQSSKSPLTFALGKDISADCKVATIDKLVHTLIAGSTNSGKSVCLNTMLLSLLYKASPEDLRLILIDPKMVEFNAFANSPHMLIPKIITDCEQAVAALGWLVEEMDRRYKRLSSLGVKKISEYNETREVISGMVPKMYYIVMIFDEVGDFMTRAKKEIEDKVLLLAAKSRACGIHLILATQRPTVNVITGTIKANLPSRIAFAVNSNQDSRTILESSGAEYLLGMGDMLFLPQGSNDMQRIQGCYVDNNELKDVINFVKEHNEAVFDEEIEDQMFNKKDGFDSSNGAEDEFDPLLKDCLKYFIKAKKASASSLQAYFGIGYPKANKIVLQMEKAGFVSPGDNNGRRVLYITQQEYEERFGEDLD